MNQALGWCFIILFSVLVIGWAMFLYFVIKDPPRHWDFGALPFVPAESVYSTRHVDLNQAPPQQLPTLPEARPPQRIIEQKRAVSEEGTP